jgi:hypothetical protein
VLFVAGISATHQEDYPMGMRDKYAAAIQTAKDLRMQGSPDERDGKRAWLLNPD